MEAYYFAEIPFMLEAKVGHDPQGIAANKK